MVTGGRKAGTGVWRHSRQMEAGGGGPGGPLPESGADGGCAGATLPRPSRAQGDGPECTVSPHHHVRALCTPRHHYHAYNTRSRQVN